MTCSTFWGVGKEGSNSRAHISGKYIKIQANLGPLVVAKPPFLVQVDTMYCQALIEGKDEQMHQRTRRKPR